eukprot:6467536-Amphidinium_carterae.2
MSHNRDSNTPQQITFSPHSPDDSPTTVPDHTTTTTANMQEENHTGFRFISYNALSITEPKTTTTTTSLPDNMGIRGIGQISYLVQRLIDLDVHVCCVQETRLALPQDFELKEFYTQHTPHQQGHGGLLTLIRKHNSTSPLHQLHINNRLQSFTFSAYGKTFTVLNLHAPVRDQPHHVHQQFQQSLLDHLHQIPQHHH